MRKSVLFLTLNPPKPSTKQRVHDSLDYLRERGLDCELLPVPYGLFGRLGMMARLRRYDVVCVQKKLMSVPEIRLMRLINHRLAFDVDDSVLFHEVERGEPLTGKYFRRFVVMADSSRAVMAGNRYLYEFAGYNNDNVHLVPTPVNASIYRPKDYDAPSGGVVIGWMGTPGNLKYLDIVAPAIRELCRRYPDVSLKIISGKFKDYDGVRTIKKQWTQAEEIEDLRSLDIGLMPLPDDIWTRGKSGNKILQYFGVGVPAVASPVGVNADIIEPGVDGFLASKTEEWVERLSALVEDPGLRRKMGMSGREKLMRRYSQEEHGRRLFEILDGI